MPQAVAFQPVRKKPRKTDQATESVKIRLTPEFKERVEALFAAKKISHIDAMTAMLEWLLKQSDLVQSVVLGQVTEATAERVLDDMLKSIRSGSKGRRAG